MITQQFNTIIFQRNHVHHFATSSVQPFVLQGSINWLSSTDAEWYPPVVGVPQML